MIIVSGPSGAGKGTIIAAALAQMPDWRLAVSATTRPRREHEIDGVSYHFMSDEVFDRYLADGQFVETVQYAAYRYGTLKSELTESRTILEIDVVGADALVDYADCTVFIKPPSLDVLHERLTKRQTESADVRAARLAIAQQELNQANRFSHVIVNDDLQHATDQLIHIMQTCGGDDTVPSPPQ